MACDLPPIGYTLGALALVDELLLLKQLGVEDPEDRAGVGGAAEVAEHRDAGHALDPAAYRVVHVPGSDGLGGEVDRLLARAAHAVERHGGYAHGKSSEHDAEARYVRTLLPSLGHCAAYDVLYLSGVNADSIDEAEEGMGEQFVGAHLAKGAVAPSERGAAGFEYHGFGHEVLLYKSSMT